MKKTIFLLIVSIFLFVAGCDYFKEAQKENTYKGRKETANVQALDAVGYNGTAVRKSVDKIMDVNDARNKEIEKVIGK
jgi:Holliday junction resolvasome RuvABC DNA-binding subunit